LYTSINYNDNRAHPLNATGGGCIFFRWGSKLCCQKGEETVGLAHCCANMKTPI